MMKKIEEEYDDAINEDKFSLSCAEESLRLLPTPFEEKSREDIKNEIEIKNKWISFITDRDKFKQEFEEWKTMAKKEEDDYQKNLDNLS